MRREPTPAETFDDTGISRPYVLNHLEFKPTVKTSRAERDHRVDNAPTRSARIVPDAARMITQANQPSSR